MSMEAFLSLLFEPGEATCFSPTPHGVGVFSAPASADLFFSINPLLSKDLQPTQSWHAATRPRRADVNVASYRNFLIELDAEPLAEQIGYVQALVPYSTCVFSGSKSHHFIISLETPLADYGQYMDLARRLHKHVVKADHSTKNPSRLSRLPFRVRPETGLQQELISLGKRIPLQVLETLLPKAPARREFSKKQKAAMVSPLLLRAAFEPDAVMADLNIQGRNQFMYWMYCRFQELDLSMEKRIKFVDSAYQALNDKSGFSHIEACFAARVQRAE